MYGPLIKPFSSNYPSSSLNDQFLQAQEKIRELPFGDLITHVEEQFNLSGGKSQAKPLSEELQGQIIQLASSKKEFGQIPISEAFRDLSPADFVVLYQILYSYEKKKAGSAIFQKTLEAMQVYLRDKCWHQPEQGQAFLHALLDAPQEETEELIQNCKNWLPKRTSILDLPQEILPLIFQSFEPQDSIAALRNISLVCKQWHRITLDSPLQLLRQCCFPSETLDPYTIYAKDFKQKLKIDNFIQEAKPFCWIESLMTKDLNKGQIEYLLNNLWLTYFPVQTLKDIEDQYPEIQHITKTLTAKGIEFYIPQFHLKSCLKDERLSIPKTVILEGLRLEIISLKDLLEKDLDSDIYLAAVKKDGRVIEQIPKHKRTEAICLAAVKESGQAVRFVPEDKGTEEIYLTAIRSGIYLKFIPKGKRTEVIYLAAVIEDGSNLTYIPEDKRTNAIYLAALAKTGYIIEQIPKHKRTEEMYLIAIRTYGSVLEFIPEEKRTEEMYLVAIKTSLYPIYVPEDKRTEAIYIAKVTQTSSALKDVPEEKRTEAIYLAAFRQDTSVFEIIPEEKRTEAIYITAFRHNKPILELIPEEKRTEAIYIAAVAQKGEVLKLIPEEKRTEAIYLAAVAQNGEALELIPEDKRTEAICIVAVKQNREALRFVPEEKRTEAIYIATIREFEHLFDLIPEDKRTEAIYIASIKKEASNLALIPREKRTDAMYIACIKKDPINFNFLPKEQRTNAVYLAIATSVESFN